MTISPLIIHHLLNSKSGYGFGNGEQKTEEKISDKRWDEFSNTDFFKAELLTDYLNGKVKIPPEGWVPYRGEVSLEDVEQRIEQAKKKVEMILLPSFVEKIAFHDEEKKLSGEKSNGFVAAAVKAASRVAKAYVKVKDKVKTQTKPKEKQPLMNRLHELETRYAFQNDVKLLEPLKDSMKKAEEKRQAEAATRPVSEYRNRIRGKGR